MSERDVTELNWLKEGRMHDVVRGVVRRRTGCTVETTDLMCFFYERMLLRIDQWAR